jgi:hypothetical protein
LQTQSISGDFAVDRNLIRYYKAAGVERRFFRHRARLRWSEENAWPAHLGVTHPRLLHFRHYPYRSPVQIQTRLDVRRDNRARGFEGWDHASELSWREKIVSGVGLHLDGQNGRLEVEAEFLTAHIESPRRRWFKKCMHGIGIWP